MQTRTAPQRAPPGESRSRRSPGLQASRAACGRAPSAIGLLAIVAAAWVAAPRIVSAVLPLSACEGVWYGPGVQRGKVLRRLVQTHRVEVAGDRASGTAVLVARKLLGDWARGDVGAFGEVLWQVREPASGGLPLGIEETPARGEFQLAPEGRGGVGSESDAPLMAPMRISAVSEDQLIMEVQGKRCDYCRAGAVGLEKPFLSLAEATARKGGSESSVDLGPYSLRRLLFDFGGALPSLLPLATPIVEVSHLWRATGVVLIAVLPSSAPSPALPSPAALASVSALHARVSAGLRRGPRLVLLWPVVPEGRDAISALGSAKMALGPKAEVYADASDGGLVSAILADAADGDAPFLLAEVAPSGSWRGIRAADGGAHAPGTARDVASAAEMLLNDGTASLFGGWARLLM